MKINVIDAAKPVQFFALMPGTMFMSMQNDGIYMKVVPRGTSNLNAVVVREPTTPPLDEHQQHSPTGHMAFFIGSIAVRPVKSIDIHF